MTKRKLTEHTLDLGDVMTLLGIKYDYVKSVKMDFEIEHNIDYTSRKEILVITVVDK